MSGWTLRRRAVLFGLALASALLAAAPSQARLLVKVGAYEFPPYLDERGEGVTPAFVELLNREQAEFRFEIVPTSPQRRFDDLQRARFDVIAFESLDWGWRKLPVSASRVFLGDGEVFVARKGPGVGQPYFDRLEGKSILGRLGFHYAFAGFNADPDLLERRFNARLTVTHEGNLRSVAAGRADLAIVTRSYLVQFLRRDPSLAERLLVSDRMDQVYAHTMLVRNGAPVGVDWINGMLDRLEAEGKLAALWKKQGIVE